jgi:hypothetical protein
MQRCLTTFELSSWRFPKGYPGIRGSTGTGSAFDHYSLALRTSHARCDFDRAIIAGRWRAIVTALRYQEPITRSFRHLLLCGHMRNLIVMVVTGGKVMLEPIAEAVLNGAFTDGL